MEKNSLDPGDPDFINKIVEEYMSQGQFDQMRRRLMADLDTKPSYQNVRQRIETTVQSFLEQLRWKPGLVKNQLRDSLKRQILSAPFLRPGVNRIVEQLANRSSMVELRPDLESVAKGLLGVDSKDVSLNEAEAIDGLQETSNDVDSQDEMAMVVVEEIEEVAIEEIKSENQLVEEKIVESMEDLSIPNSEALSDSVMESPAPQPVDTFSTESMPESVPEQQETEEAKPIKEEEIKTEIKEEVLESADLADLDDESNHSIINQMSPISAGTPSPPSSPSHTPLVDAGLTPIKRASDFVGKIPKLQKKDPLPQRSELKNEEKSSRKYSSSRENDNSSTKQDRKRGKSRDRDSKSRDSSRSRGTVGPSESVSAHDKNKEESSKHSYSSDREKKRDRARDNKGKVYEKGKNKHGESNSESRDQDKIRNSGTDKSRERDRRESSQEKYKKGSERVVHSDGKSRESGRDSSKKDDRKRNDNIISTNSSEKNRESERDSKKRDDKKGNEKESISSSDMKKESEKNSNKTDERRRDDKKSSSSSSNEKNREPEKGSHKKDERSRNEKSRESEKDSNKKFDKQRNEKESISSSEKSKEPEKYSSNRSDDAKNSATESINETHEGQENKYSTTDDRNRDEKISRKKERKNKYDGSKINDEYENDKEECDIVTLEDKYNSNQQRCSETNLESKKIESGSNPYKKEYRNDRQSRRESRRDRSREHKKDRLRENVESSVVGEAAQDIGRSEDDNVVNKYSKSDRVSNHEKDANTGRRRGNDSNKEEISVYDSGKDTRKAHKKRESRDISSDKVCDADSSDSLVVEAYGSQSNDSTNSSSSQIEVIHSDKEIKMYSHEVPSSAENIHKTLDDASRDSQGSGSTSSKDREQLPPKYKIGTVSPILTRSKGRKKSEDTNVTSSKRSKKIRKKSGKRKSR